MKHIDSTGHRMHGAHSTARTRAIAPPGQPDRIRQQETHPLDNEDLLLMAAGLMTAMGIWLLLWA